MQHKHYEGLSPEQVLQSRERDGTNILTPPPQISLFKLFLKKFQDPLILILLLAGFASLLISFYEYFVLHSGGQVFFEPSGIFVAIFLATGLAFYFEQQAEKEFTILNRLCDDEPVEVIRSGNTTQIAKKDVVVGDIVVLNTGDEIPADALLLESVDLSIDESSLTGEPICKKSTKIKEKSTATYPANHVMKGTKVMEGHGICQVLFVGDKTEQGKVFEAAQLDNSIKTPLNEQLEWLGGWITKVSYIFAGLVIFGRILLYVLQPEFSLDNFTAFIAYFLQTIMIAVTLIVVAVPEGLPMAVTLSLAYSMRRMLKTNNLVRRMHACETMGATTVICTDKTGTLTQNQMRVEEMKVFCKEPHYSLMLEGLAVNSTASLDFSAQKPEVLGNPTEGALLLWLYAQHCNYEEYRENTERIREIPFSTERKYMATIVKSCVLPEHYILYVKGAPELLLPHCHEIPERPTAEIYQQLLHWQKRAMRTLGFAYLILEKDELELELSELVKKKLTFIGFAAIADPLRPEVPAAVAQCRQAGIQVKIVTGDTLGTAKEIGRQIGLWQNTDTKKNCITGTELMALSDEELQQRLPFLKIIARARPMDKKRLVEALQQQNEVVAVTGDGTNDAPALKSAHIGLSMGDGTSVAKEASDITIMDNSFGSIGKAVMWGRSLYQNIQRFLLFQLTVNVTACFLVLSGAFLGTESPLTVTQMLWINLIMDTFAAMALASLPPSEKVMLDKPRHRKAFILDKKMMVNIVGIGGFFFLLLLGLLLIFLHTDVQQLSDIFTWQWSHQHHISTYELTLLFTVFVMTHFFYLFNARAYATGKSALDLKDCRGLVFISALIFCGQIILVEVPGLQQFFNVQGLKIVDWIIIIACSSLVLWVREIAYFLCKQEEK